MFLAGQVFNIKLKTLSQILSYIDQYFEKPII